MNSSLSLLPRGISQATLRSRPSIRATGLLLGAAFVFFCATSISSAAIELSGDNTPPTISLWNPDTAAVIGVNTTGTLTITDTDGTLQNKSTEIGLNASSNGTATIIGATLLWTMSDSLVIGVSGAGSLNVQSGGLVSDSYGSIGSDFGSDGTATVTGPNSTWNTTNSLNIGGNGKGTLNIQSGGLVTDSDGLIEDAHALGTVSVTGTGSTWTNTQSLQIGSTRDYFPELVSQYTATLTVANGGLVTAKTLYAPLSSLLGDGVITVHGAVLDGNVVINDASATQHHIAFGTGGTLNLDFDGTGIVGAGFKGTGSLKIADGVHIVSSSGCIGYHFFSSGTVTVTGSGSTWTNSAELNIGYNGDGSLIVENGGVVSNTNAYLGGGYLNPMGPDEYVFHGQALVKGNASKWINNGNIYVGCGGNGFLEVQTGGEVSCSNAYIGYNGESNCYTHVEDANSKLLVGQSLYVGYDSSGRLEIGGLVAARNLILATHSYVTAGCSISSGGTLQVGTVSKGNGAVDITWFGGTIRNFDASTNLVIPSGLELKIKPMGIYSFFIDSGRSGTVSAVISETFPDSFFPSLVRKLGGGLLTLTAANTYPDYTVISEGTLALSNTGSLASSRIQVASGAKFDVSAKSGGFFWEQVKPSWVREPSWEISRLPAFMHRAIPWESKRFREIIRCKDNSTWN